MSDIDLILCRYEGKAVYIGLLKDGTTVLPNAKEAAIEGSFFCFSNRFLRLTICDSLQGH